MSLGHICQVGKEIWSVYISGLFPSINVESVGDVVSVGAFGNRIIIVNSEKAASELFDKRGAIYSDRPGNVMIHDLCVLPGTQVAQR